MQMDALPTSPVQLSTMPDAGRQCSMLEIAVLQGVGRLDTLVGNPHPVRLLDPDRLLPGEVLEYALMLPALVKDLPHQVILQQV